jgi:hypothetical protein
MEKNRQAKTLNNLLKNPAEILNVVQNPGKYGMDIYKGLDTRQKQYLLIAAGVGLIGYGIYLGRKQGNSISQG